MRVRELMQFFESTETKACWISLNLFTPPSSSRMMRSVHMSPTISEALAIGQSGFLVVVLVGLFITVLNQVIRRLANKPIFWPSISWYCKRALEGHFILK